MIYSAVQTFHAYSDGDVITPGMGVSIPDGYGLFQYFNPNTGKVTQTDFEALYKNNTPVILFPQAYSSKMAKYIEPQTQGQQWYYNSVNTEGEILENGKVKTKYASLFEVTTVSMNGLNLPGLKLKGNLASAADHTDKYIYYQSSYDGKQFLCQQVIPIQEATGESYDIFFSILGKDGSGDRFLSADNDWCKYTAHLQRGGINVEGGVTFKFQKLDGGTWKDLTTQSGCWEVDTNSLKVYDKGVEGTEIFRCVATYQGTQYFATFEITDDHDTYYIDMGCSTDSDAVGPGETVTFNPVVLLRNGGIPDSTHTWTFGYTYTKNGSTDPITSLTNKNKFTYEDLRAAGGLTVRIDATGVEKK